MNIKPLMQHSEFEVLNFFALNQTGDKGLAVTIADSGFNPTARLLLHSDLSSQVNILSPRWKVHTQCRPAVLGEVPVGITLKRTLEVNFLGSPLLYDSVRLNEADAVYSGMPVPILQRGYLLVGSFSGAAIQPSWGQFAITTGQGQWKVQGPNSTGLAPSGAFAEFLGPIDRDGYALAYVNCHRI